MKFSKGTLFICCNLLIAFLWVHASDARIYKWKDKNGKMHFTDSLQKIPPQYRKDIKPAVKKKKINRASQKFMSRFKMEWKTWPRHSSRVKDCQKFEECKKWQSSERYLEMKRNNQIPRTPVSFSNVEFVEWRGRRGHESFFPIAGMPISGVEQVVEASVGGDVDTAAFRLVTSSGEEIKPLDLRRHPEQSLLSDDYLGPLVPPDQPFRIAVSGLDRYGEPYDITYPKVFQAKGIVFEKVMRSRLSFNQGKEFIYANVTNYGRKGTFTIKVTDNQGFIKRVEPTSMRLDTGETKKLEVDLWIPADTPEHTRVIVKLVVTSDSNLNISNTAEKSSLVTIIPTIKVPPDITVASTGRYTKVDIGKATATDNRGIHSIKNDAPKKGFPVGTTKVTWDATDTSGNHATAVQNITVTP